MDIIAKTGTADSLGSAFKTHGWFIGAYPAENPRFALVIFMKNAHGYGAPTALARKVFKKIKEHENDI